MPLIDLKDIPDYLQNSLLYRSLNGNESVSFFVPKYCLRVTATGVDSENAFAHILRTMHFWVVMNPPRDVLKFILANDVCGYKFSNRVLWKLLLSFEFAEELLIVKNLEPSLRIQYAVKNRFRCTLIKDLIALGHSLPRNMCALAAAVGSEDILRMAVENGCEVTSTALHLVVAEARIETLYYLHSCGICFDPHLIVAASRRGKLRSLEFFAEIGALLEIDACAAAAGAGHLPCLQYLHQHGAAMNTRVVVEAARNDHLMCMQYAVQHGAALTEAVTLAACANDSINCLQYAFERRCPINTDAILAAVRIDSIQCLQLAHRMGAPWDENVCAEAALYGHFNCLMYAHHYGCPWDEKTIANAVWSGHWQCRTYAVRNGCLCIAHGICIICFGYTLVVFIILAIFPAVRKYSLDCLLILDAATVCGLMSVYLHLLQRRWPCIDWARVHTVLCNCVTFLALAYVLYFLWLVLYLVYLLLVLAFLIVKLFFAYAEWYFVELLLDFAETEESMLF